MKILDLFSGIGGFSLGFNRAGFETVAFCEKDKFCKKVLKKHWPETIVHDDIFKLDGGGYSGIDVITGGYPCQPFSVAGKKKGSEDSRNLWPEMFRVIKQSRPAWVVCENVYGHIRLGLDGVLLDLESEGYSTRTFIVPACSVGAQHRRDRVWIVANTNSFRIQRMPKKQVLQKRQIQGRQSFQQIKNIREMFNKPEAGLCRSLHGIPNGVDRIKSLGNSVIPQITYKIALSIKLCS